MVRHVKYAILEYKDKHMAFTTNVYIRMFYADHYECPKCKQKAIPPQIGRRYAIDYLSNKDYTGKTFCWRNKYYVYSEMFVNDLPKCLCDGKPVMKLVKSPMYELYAKISNPFIDLNKLLNNIAPLRFNADHSRFGGGKSRCFTQRDCVFLKKGYEWNIDLFNKNHKGTVVKMKILIKKRELKKQLLEKYEQYRIEKTARMV